jgi:hypothetical protein
MYHLYDIHISKNLIILYFHERFKRVVRLWYYDIDKLKEFILYYINRHKYDVGIVASLQINNRHNISNSYIRLVYSNYYEYINKKCIEKLLINDGDTENDTITLFKRYESLSNQPKELIRCSGDDDLLCILLFLSNTMTKTQNINRRISSLVDNTRWVHYESYNKFKDDLTKTRSLN